MAHHIEISTEGLNFKELERTASAAAKKFPAGTLPSSMRGRLGEIAVYAFLKGSLPECTVIDDAFSGATAYDIEVSKNPIQAETERVGIEVKTTTYQGWLRRGRIIGRRQLLDTNADVYVWCATGSDRYPDRVVIVGWLTTMETVGHTRTLDRTKARWRFSAPIDASSNNYSLAEPGSYHDDTDDSGCDESEHVLSDEDARQRLISSSWLGGTEPMFGGYGCERIRVEGHLREPSELLSWIRTRLDD